MEAPGIHCRYAHEIAATYPGGNGQGEGRDPLASRNEKADTHAGNAETHKDSPSRVMPQSQVGRASPRAANPCESSGTSAARGDARPTCFIEHRCGNLTLPPALRNQWAGSFGSRGPGDCLY